MSALTLSPLNIRKSLLKFFVDLEVCEVIIDSDVQKPQTDLWCEFFTLNVSEADPLEIFSSIGFFSDADPGFDRLLSVAESITGMLSLMRSIPVYDADNFTDEIARMVVVAKNTGDTHTLEGGVKHLLMTINFICYAKL